MSLRFCILKEFGDALDEGEPYFLGATQTFEAARRGNTSFMMSAREIRSRSSRNTYSLQLHRPVELARLIGVDRARTSD